MRNYLYGFVSKEGDFTLHFFSDFIRGHTRSDSSKAEKKQQETPLNYEERKVFQELLDRRKGENQIDYWKRKKAMNDMADKKGFVAEEMERRKSQSLNEKRNQANLEIQEKRSLEMQRKRIEMAKYSSSVSSQHKRR